MGISVGHRNASFLILIVGCVALLASASFLSVAKNKVTLEQDIQTKSAFLAVEPEEIFVGNPNARVVVLEYFDFDCPFCKTYHETQESLLIKKYAQDSVAFARRHRPIIYLHKNAVTKAQMFECALVQRPESYADATMFLYAKQFTVFGVYTSEFAQKVRVDVEMLRRCMADGTADGVIGPAMAKGAIQGVSATPTFVIFKDGKERARIVGNRVSQIETSIDLLLSEQ